ncbi:hypothetical protein NGM37_13240, partial [Streptomyces sp. TRM76130]|nr:hypothetical protein [Streptomyces sp. TRM76130]
DLNPATDTFTTPTGSTAQLDSDGTLSTLSTLFADGSEASLNTDTGALTVTDADGNVTTDQLDVGESFT